ncbi:TPA: hypothetical protein NIA64_003517 [Pseudomonas aeruginosa]|nr:hypothetical protein [Pseudomonas aeruginosa]
MSIDWSKAPEGATHYQPESRGFHAAWFRLQGGKAREMWVVIPGGALEHIIDPTVFDESMQNLIARPAEPATWNGKGLPPVGTVCIVEPHNTMWGFSSTSGYERKILAYYGEYVWLGHAETPLETTRIDKVDFRPLRTPEQIAAAERWAAIQQMLAFADVKYGDGELMSPKEYVETAVAALYDAGYRRQEEGK